MTKPTPPNRKLDIEALLEGLEGYHPARKGWTWRDVPEGGVTGAQDIRVANNRRL